MFDGPSKSSYQFSVRDIITDKDMYQQWIQSTAYQVFIIMDQNYEIYVNNDFETSLRGCPKYNFDSDTDSFH